MSDALKNVVQLSNVRLSFPWLITPQETKDDKGKVYYKYNSTFLMSPDHPGFAKFMVKVGELALEGWKEKASNAMVFINDNNKQRCYGRGEEKKSTKTFAPFEGYVGQVYISAKSDSRPQVFNGRGVAIPIRLSEPGIDPNTGNTVMVDLGENPEYINELRKMYGGCRVNVVVKPWLQGVKKVGEGGIGVRCELVAIQFAGDDTPFGDKKVNPQLSVEQISAAGLFGSVATSTPPVTVPGVQMPAAPFSAGLPSFLTGQ